MASVKFLLRNKKAIKFVTIYYAVNLSANIRVRGATKFKIHPKYWDDENQRVRNMTDVSEIRDNININLTSFKNFALKTLSDYDFYDLSKIKKELKKDIDIYFGKTSEKKELTFYTFSEQFIEQSKNRIIDNTGRTLSKRTTAEYKKTLELLKDFEKKYRYAIHFESIDMNFYNLFVEYLESLDFGVNTIGKFIKQVKVFMNAATEANINTNLIFKNRRFIKPTTQSVQVYLNEAELKKIIELNLTQHHKLNHARNLFIIGAYTGLRVSDYNRLSKSNIYENNGIRFIKLTVQKTGKPIRIPIHSEIEKILIKNDGNFPKKMPEQHINIALKSIGFKAKINDEITLTKIKGGKKLTYIKKKYEIIFNHTGRRSFCTNAYIAGMPTIDIMAISGHTSENIFLNYIKITLDERAIKIAENPFFKAKSELKIG